MLGLQLGAPQRILPCNGNTVRNGNQPIRSLTLGRTKPQESRKGVRCFAEGTFENRLKFVPHKQKGMQPSVLIRILFLLSQGP
jgi:hypothetical protein